MAGLLVLGLFVAGSTGLAAERNTAVDPALADTSKIAAYFKDTAGAGVFVSHTRTFNLRTRGQRDSLRAILRKERASWRAKRPGDYRYLLRVGCFCPGVRGWLLMDVRKTQPLRAWDRTGKAVPINDRNVFSIDDLFDNLNRSADRDAVVELAFDSRWHFPAYVRTVALPVPDAWAIIEARALRRSTPE